MELIQIDVVCLQQSQGFFKLLARIVLHAAFGFACKKTILAIWCQRRPQPLLRIAIAGSDVEVIDAAIHRFRHYVLGVSGVLIHYNDAAKANDREVLTCLSEWPSCNGLCRCGGCEPGARSSRGGKGALLYKVTTFHSWGNPPLRNIQKA